MNTCVVFIQHILSDKHHLFKMHIHEAYHLRMIIQSTHYNITGKSDSSYAEKKKKEFLGIFLFTLLLQMVFYTKLILEYTYQ